MKKMDMQTPDLTSENVKKLGELFPQVVTEKEGEDGVTTRSVDFDLLRQLLSDSLVEGVDERYRLDWPGKKRSHLKANTPITKTLRPMREESVDFDTTQNLFIEGDNFEALKILQESYLGKVKMIYIDPPYNTGKDFVYSDKHTMDEEDYIELTGAEDEEGNKMFKENTRTNPLFHSDWLSMMYERLIIARDLLRDDGVIFISIDDNEVHNLRKVCDEIFGESNFIAQMIVDATPKNDPYVISTAHEYVIVYVKELEKAKEANYGIANQLYKKIIEIFENDKSDYDKVEENLKTFYKNLNLASDNIANYKYADKLGVYRIGPIDDPQSSGPKDERINPLTGKPCKIPSRGWSCTKDTWDEWQEQGLIRFPDTDDSIPDKKTYITEDRLDVMRAYIKVQTRKDSTFLRDLFGTSITPFSNPKPVSLLKQMIENSNDKESIYLDFFAGSGSFAQAVLEVNANDGGGRKFIIAQLPEEIIVSGSNKEKKVAQAAINFLKSINKPTNVAELAKERIRRAAAKIRADFADKLSECKEKGLPPLDTGFRTYRVDDTNMKDVFYHPSEVTQESLLGAVDKVKADRNPEDLLTQVMLELGITLDLSIETLSLAGNTVYAVAGNALLACFDTELHEGVIDEIAKREPLRLVLRDATFGTGDDRDQKRVNFETRMKRLSPDTVITVL